MGKILVLIGIIIVAMGLLLMFFENVGWRMPGDIYYRRDGVVIWIPIVTMIILSLILTLILNLLFRR